MSFRLHRLLRRKTALVDPRGLAGFYRVARIPRSGGYVLASIPKSGSSSLREALNRCEALRGNFPDSSDTHNYRRYNNQPFFYRDIVAGLRQWPVFVIVRNPYSRALSSYNEKIVKTFQMIEDGADPSRVRQRQRRMRSVGLSPSRPPTFEEFTEAVTNVPYADNDQHFAPQSYLAAFHAVPYDFIGRLEAYEEDMDALSSLLFEDASFWRRAEKKSGGKRNINYKGGGTTENIERHFTVRAAENVRRYYAEDFRVFGYSDDLADATSPPPRPEPTRSRRNVPAAFLRVVGLEFTAKLAVYHWRVGM